MIKFIFVIASFLLQAQVSPTERVLPCDHEIRGVYVTAFTIAGREERVLDLVREENINALVIDVKDFSGRVFIPFDHPSSRPLISPSLIDRLKDEGLYLIARVTVFQDPFFAPQNPHLAISMADGSLWKDNLGLYWIDPASTEAWDYHLRIAKESLSIGFDEVNFDYIRFPSDGPLSEAVYPLWNRLSRRDVIGDFHSFLRDNLKGEKISASLFGLTTVATGDLGIGQILEDAFLYDYISPMVYPSHYASGFLGVANPAEHPYEVVFHSLRSAKERSEGEEVKILPWLQDFNLGAIYDREKIVLQIEAVRDALGEEYCGYLLWNSSNVYTRLNYQ